MKKLFSQKIKMAHKFNMAFSKLWQSSETSKCKNFQKPKPKPSKPETVKVSNDLMQRLFVARQSRPDINFKDAIGKYEFSAVPKSLLTIEGAMLLAHSVSTI
jgi:hypothetical protein